MRMNIHIHTLTKIVISLFRNLRRQIGLNVLSIAVIVTIIMIIRENFQKVMSIYSLHGIDPLKGVNSLLN